MFSGRSEIAPVVDLLEARLASLWHACQLRDLRSYLAIGGIPSRSLLEQAGADFTPFATDSSDRSKGLWSKVFVNLGDFGASFARGWAAVPNPYGPIALQVRPRALLRAQDVAICVRSAGAWDFDREIESLASVGDVDRVFLHAADADPFDRMETRFGETLRGVFAPRYPNATATEVSISIEPELIPLEDVVVFWVDPIAGDAADLMTVVEEALRARGLDAPVRRRQVTAERRGVFTDLARILNDGSIPNPRLMSRRADVSAETQRWLADIVDRDLAWQFERYARYLTEGTLNELDRVASSPVPSPADIASVKPSPALPRSVKPG